MMNLLKPGMIIENSDGALFFLFFVPENSVSAFDGRAIRIFAGKDKDLKLGRVVHINLSWPWKVIVQ